MTGVFITVDQGRIWMRTPYELKEAVKSLSDRKWDGDTKRWHSPASPRMALEVQRRLGQGPGVVVDTAFRELLAAGQSAVRAESQKDAHDLPDLPTKTVAWSHQRQAFHFAKEQGAAMLAMDMGTGKSLTAIGLLEEWNAKCVVILGPRRALPVWPKQFRVHAQRDWSVIVPPATAPVLARVAYIQRQMVLALADKRPMAICVNYEAAWREVMSRLLLEQDWDVLIADESHRTKSPGGKASRFLQTLRRRCDRALALTGTPMPHSPMDIYAQYRFLDTSVFGTSFNRFRARYAIMGGYEGRQVVGYWNSAELEQKIGSLAYFCKSDEVLDLPEYHHTQEYCELEPDARRAYTSMEEDFIAMVKEADSDEQAMILADNALVKLLRLQQITGGWVRDDNEVYHRVSTAKQELLADVLEDIAKDEPLVIFGRFQHDLDAIRAVSEAQGRKYAELSGRVKETDVPQHLLAGKLSASGQQVKSTLREGKIESGLTVDATMRDDIDVIGVQIQAGGVGIDLTRSRYGIYYSMGYSLGDYEQSLKRVHRPGQTRATTYIHLIAQGTVDEKVYAALAERKSVVEALIRGARRSNGNGH